MDYKEIIFGVRAPHSEELMARLSALGFESFVEEEERLKAYIPEPDYSGVEEAMLGIIREAPGLGYWESGDIEEQNWNENWERSYAPVVVADRVLIRAPFHGQAPEGMMDIVIEPRMSFGTGHHQTTTLMVGAMLDIDFHGLDVLDMGSGTGILSIVASRLGAASVLAVDNHPWAAVNGVENMERNGIANVRCVEGEEGAIRGSRFDLILANINRNVLLAQIPVYSSCLAGGGRLLMSGFYADDLAMIGGLAGDHGLSLTEHNTLERWTVALFTKD